MAAAAWRSTAPAPLAAAPAALWCCSNRHEGHAEVQRGDCGTLTYRRGCPEDAGSGGLQAPESLGCVAKGTPKRGGCAMCIRRRCEQVLHSNLGPLQSLFKMSPAVQLKLFAASCKRYHAPTPYFLEINGDYAPLAQFAPMSQCPMYSVGKHGTWRVQRASGPAFVINGHHTA